MSVLLLHLIERRDEMKKIILDHLKQDLRILVIKIFSERKKREKQLKNFVQRGIFFCWEWSSIYRQEIPSCKGPHYTKDFPLKEEGKTLKEAYYTQFGAPFQGGGYRAAAPGFYQRNNANPSYQERRQSMEETLSKFMGDLAKRHKENSNLIKEIRTSTKAALRNQGASTETNPRDHVKLISTTIKADTSSIRRIGSPQYAVSTGQNNTLMYDARQTTIPFLSHLNDYYCEEKKGSYGPQFSEAYSYGASHIDNSIPRKEKDPRRLGELAHTKLTVELADRTVKYPKGIAKNMLVRVGKFVFPIDIIFLYMPEDIKVPLILRRPFLSTARAKIDVFKRKITLRVGEEKIIFKSVKPASSVIKRVYLLSLRERMELDLEARLMGETLVLNRSLNPLFGDYIELNDLNVPLDLRRNQVNDLIPTIEESKVTKEFRARNDAMISGYPSDFDHDKKIRIDCTYNLKFSCMTGFEFIHAIFFPVLYVNVKSKKFYNSIMKEKLEYKGNNVVGALMNVPIFNGTFSVLTDFALLEDMNDYRDEGMGGVIFCEPFLREVEINARRFDGMITIYNGDDEVSEDDKKNGISHPYQKLKKFYIGVLNLGPEFIRDPSMEEWLTRRHVSVHEME
ncbi:putative reverse transcriptase domain-containing protein [Tanacetum coccineum]